MHRHDHDQTENERTGPATARVDAPNPLLMPAAAAGRTDVLGAAGLLDVQRAAGNGAAAGVTRRSARPFSTCSPPAARRSTSTRARTWSPGWATTSATSGSTPAAPRTARRLGQAHAYTVGSNIVFQRGAYDPGSAAGKTLLAHELTHVVQQRTGPSTARRRATVSGSATRPTASSRPPRPTPSR